MGGRGGPDFCPCQAAPAQPLGICVHSGTCSLSGLGHIPAASVCTRHLSRGRRPVPRAFPVQGLWLLGGAASPQASQTVPTLAAPLWPSVGTRSQPLVIPVVVDLFLGAPE